jgi:hypothetical protein
MNIGSDIEKISDNTVKIYADSLNETYLYDKGDKKTIGFIWYNKTDDNEFVGITDGNNPVNCATKFKTNSHFDEYKYLQYVNKQNTLMSYKTREEMFYKNLKTLENYHVH